MQWAQCFQSSKALVGNPRQPICSTSNPENRTQNTKVQREVGVIACIVRAKHFAYRASEPYCWLGTDGGTRGRALSSPTQKSCRAYFITVFQWESTSNAGPRSIQSRLSVKLWTGDTVGRGIAEITHQGVRFNGCRVDIGCDESVHTRIRPPRTPGYEGNQDESQPFQKSTGQIHRTLPRGKLLPDGSDGLSGL